MPDKKGDQRGQVLVLALIALAVGALVAGPLLTYVDAGVSSLQRGSDSMGVYYAADSGVEHAIWQVYKGGLVLSSDVPYPYTYSTVNGLPVNIVITNKSPDTSSECSDNAPGGQSNKVTVGRTVSPLSAPPGQLTTFTYTITFKNVGTNNLHFNEIGYTLPDGFNYVVGSSTGVTTNNPLLVDGSLAWDFDTPLPNINTGQTLTEHFQATGILSDGVYCDYCDAAWVVFQPASVGCVVFKAGDLYNVQATAGTDYVQSAVLISGGSVRVLSWNTR